MDKSSFKLDDIKRILIGNAPPEFLIEVFIRTLLMYFLLLVIIRLLGKRMTGQLTITELAVMLTLGAIVAAPMQMPDRGILQGLLLLFCILFLQRSVTGWGVKNLKIEKLTQGELSILVKDGVMQLKEMDANRIPREQLFAEIRSHNIYQLGKIERLYLEACGLFSIYAAEKPRPGLSVLPPTDAEIHDLQQKVEEKFLMACASCGNTITTQQLNETCPVCGKHEWMPAVI